MELGTGVNFAILCRPCVVDAHDRLITLSSKQAMANWGYYSRVGSKHSSPQFLFLCVFFAVCTTTALGRGVQTCNKGEEEACNVDDSSSNWLSDARMWNPGKCQGIFPCAISHTGRT